MTREQALVVLRNAPCKYAVLTLDVCSGGEVCYPREKVVVSVLETQNPFANIGKYFTTFESIKDFRENSVFGEAEARKTYCNYYFGEIYEIDLID
jgi:hypothetical protein